MVFMSTMTSLEDDTVKTGVHKGNSKRCSNYEIASWNF
jgi:hypothetical protein